MMPTIPPEVQAILDKYGAGENPEDEVQSILNKYNAGNAPPQDAGEFALPTPPEVDVQIPETPEVPFGAIGMDDMGNPFYGTGLKGWIRQTYADLFDPQKRFNLVEMEQADWERVDTEIQQKTQAANENVKPVFGIDLLEEFTGLTNEEAATAWVSLFGPSTLMKQKTEAAVEAGEMTTGEAKVARGGAVAAQSFNMTRDLVQRSLWGALEIIGITDTTVRKGVSALVALNTIEGRSSPLQQVFTGSLGKTVRAIVSGEKTPAEIGARVDAYMHGSSAAYTLVFDEMKRAEFERRIENGEDPALVAQGIANPWIELAGSLLGDPASYFGAAIPTLSKVDKFGNLLPAAKFGLGKLSVKLPWRVAYYTPSFAEAFGLNVGKLRLANKIESKFFSPSSDNLLRDLEKAATSGSDDKALKTYGEALSKEAQRLYAMNLAGDANKAARKAAAAKGYNVFALRSTDKAAKISADMGMFTGILIKNEGADKTAAILRDLRLAYGASSSLADKKLALQRLATIQGYKGMMFSDSAQTTGIIIDSLNEKVFDELLSNYGDNPTKFGEKLFYYLEKAVEGIFPSVDEMRDAANRVKAGSKVTKDLLLAEKYEDVPLWAKGFTKATKGIRRLQDLNISGQAKVYLNTPGYAVRNVGGQTAIMALHFGLGKALDMASDAAINVTTKRANNFVDALATRMADSGFYVPAEIREGIGSVGAKGKGFFLQAGQNTEMVQGSRIIEEVTFSEARKAAAPIARAGLSQLVESNVLTKEQANLLYGFLDKYNFNEGKALTEFRAALGGDYLEDWRHMPITGTLRDHLFKSNKLDEIYRIQREAKTQSEFAEQTERVLKEIADAAYGEAVKETADVGRAAEQFDPGAMEEVGELRHRANEGEFTTYMLEDFEARVQAYANVRLTLSTIEKKVINLAGEMTGQNPALAPLRDQMMNGVEAVAKEWSAKTPVSVSMRQKLWQLINESNNTDDMLSLWNKSIHGKAGFSLADMYPQIDPTTLSPKQYRDLLVEGWTFWKEGWWRNGNNRYFQQLNGIFDGFFKGAGTSLEDVASQNIGQMGNPFTELQKAMREAHAWEQAGAVNPEIRKMLQSLPQDAKLSQLEWGAWQSVMGENPKYAFNMVNADRKAAGLTAYGSYDRVPVREAIEAHLRRTPNKIPVPYAGGDASEARVWWESMPALQDDFRAWQKGVSDNWGVTTQLDNIPEEAEVGFSKFSQTFGDQMKYVRAKSVALGVETRNFLLFDYRKSYLDLARAFLKPFGYWQNKAYATSMELLLSNPKWASRYLAFKQFNEREHAGLPDWWKQNVGLNIPGINNGNPVFMNLEANLNPIYTMTGVDFNDPRKRVDWITSLVDDIGKQSGALTTPINWAMAAYLYGKGEDEAGERWAGRLFPQTRAIKATLNVDVGGKNLLELLGLSKSESFGMKHGEFDPLVNFLGDGLDAYERNRVNQALAQMVDNGEITAEAAVDAHNLRSGPLWDMATERAIDKRSFGAISSFFGGPGFNARTEQDIRIDQFYGSYYKLIGLRDTMTPEEYRSAWDTMREQYPFMDGLLIGRKSGADKDAAFGYNVLGRIPPGDMTRLLQLVGVSQNEISRFYDNKGDMSKWTEGDRMRFNAAMADLSSIMLIPQRATREEWTQVKDLYKDMQQRVSENLGMNLTSESRGVWDVVDRWRELEGQEAKDYWDLHPEIARAFELQNAYLANTPLLYRYYGSISTLDSYANNQRKSYLITKYGEGIYDLQEEYYAIKQKYGYDDKLVQKAQKEFKKAHPELEKFWEESSSYQDTLNRAVVRLAENLPSQPQFETREPQSETQMLLAQTLNASPTVSADVIKQQMTPELLRLVEIYFSGGGQLSYYARAELKYIADGLGISTDEALQILGTNIQ